MLLGVLPLTNDEAYYWVWSQHPQLSYFDHPPFVAWLFGLGEYLRFIRAACVGGCADGARGLAIWLSTLGRWLGPRERFWWLALSLTSALLGGSQLIITPRTSRCFSSSRCATWTYLRWLARPTRWWSLGLGLAVGLGFTSKYMMVLFPLALVVPTLRDAPARTRILARHSAADAGADRRDVPVWAWNIANDFASFRFQAHHGLGRTIYKPSWTTEYIGLQLALITPWLAFLAWRGRRDAPAFVSWLAITPLLFFGLTTSRGLRRGQLADRGLPGALEPERQRAAGAARVVGGGASDSSWSCSASCGRRSFGIRRACARRSYASSTSSTDRGEDPRRRPALRAQITRWPRA